MPPASVRLDQVEKRFGSTVAVHSLDLAATEGEFLVLLGPSGCGKSTVLRLIAGLEEPTSGRILIGSTDVTGVEARERDVAMVFQSYALYPHLSVRRNIEFPLRARRVPSAQRAQMVAATASSLQLGPLLDRKPAQLSGGQRQRVALARAIVRNPRAFLMDEPLSNLDARLRVEMRAELVELHRRTGTTVVYVTHDQVEAMTMGDRIAVMRDGELQQIGPPQQVHDHPANVFVAGFIGSPPMNLLDGEIVGGAVKVDGGEIPLGSTAAPSGRAPSGSLPSGSASPGSAPSGSALSGSAPSGSALSGSALSGSAPPTRPGAAGEVVVGVRPEDLVVDAGGTLRATVSLVESLGHEHHLACRMGDRATTAATGGGGGDVGIGGAPLVLVRVPASSPPPAVGELVQLKVTGPVHLFDRESGRSLHA